MYSASALESVLDVLETVFAVIPSNTDTKSDALSTSHLPASIHTVQSDTWQIVVAYFDVFAHVLGPKTVFERFGEFLVKTLLLPDTPHSHPSTAHLKTTSLGLVLSPAFQEQPVYFGGYIRALLHAMTHQLTPKLVHQISQSDSVDLSQWSSSLQAGLAYLGSNTLKSSKHAHAIESLAAHLKLSSKLMKRIHHLTPVALKQVCKV
jgi:hypothetical protein